MTHKPDCIIVRYAHGLNGIEFRALCTCDHQGLLDEIHSLRNRIRIAHAYNVRASNKPACECDVCKR